MSNDKVRKGANLGYYCGAKFDTIPTLSILPPLPNHWRSSESKSTPSSPVPTSVIDTKNRTPSGSSVPSGRNTAPVLKAASLPTATARGHDINSSFTKMNGRDKISNAGNLPNQGKSKGKGKVPVHKREDAAAAINVKTVKAASVSDKAKEKANSSAEGGIILMAMLQSVRVRTESIETDKVSHSTPTYSKDEHSSTLKVTTAEPLTKPKSEPIVSSTQQYLKYGTCQQQNEGSSEHLKALLKVCT